jgi:hypothetical protein
MLLEPPVAKLVTVDLAGRGPLLVETGAVDDELV